jgi:hypothetical protein
VKSFMNQQRSWYKNRMVAVLAMMCATLGAVPLFASAHIITVTPQVDCVAQTVTVTVTAWVGHVQIVNLGTHQVTNKLPTLDSNLSGTAIFTVAEIGGNGSYTAGRQEDTTGNDPTPVPFTVNCPKVQPAIATTPSAGGAVGIAIHDVANVSGGNSPTGDVTFNLYDPSQATCAGPAAFTETKGLVSGQATSGDYTTLAVGTYRWTATYNGDANNMSASSDCQAEQVTVRQAQPAIATAPSAAGAVGSAIHDVANVSGGFNPTGTVTFNLYDPSQATCAGPAVFTDTQPLASGSAKSGDYTTLAVGTYRWTAAYSGDANNMSASSDCQAEQVTTSQAQPAIATVPSAGGVVGVVIHDVANVTGGLNPTGTVTFNLYDPSQATCQGNPVFTDTPALANGTATSSDYTTAAVGTYRWTATYSGDGNNLGATSGCQDEQVAISQAHPAIATTPSAGGVIGVAIHDVANVTGGLNPTGTVTFNLYDPSQPTCAAEIPIFTDTKALANGSATSGAYTTAAVGTYRWKASYSGDNNNLGVTSGCQDEQVTINQAQPAIATTPSAGGLVGTDIHDVANVTGGFNPTGNVTFNLYDPSQASCAGTPVFTDTQALVNGQATSGTFATVAVGTYRWTATYSGDANNIAVTSGCDAEQVVVTSPESGVQAANVSLPNTGHSGLMQSLVLALLMVLLGIAILIGQAYHRRAPRRVS